MAARYLLGALPVELLQQVMEYLPDMAALSRLFTAFPETKPPFITYGNGIVSSILDNMSPELRNAALDVLVTRNCSPMPPREMTIHISNCLDAEAYDRLRLSDYWPSALLDLIEVSGSIESLTESFARDRVLIPCEQQHSIQLSPVELHRIRRSLWRFQLCYEMCHPGDVTPPQEFHNVDPRSTRLLVHYQPRHPISYVLPNWLQSRGETFRPEALSLFLPNLTLWEQDEIEAVRFHLAQQVNRIQCLRSCCPSYDHLHGQPLLLQCLIRDIDHWNPYSPTDHVLVTSFHQSLRPPHNLIVWERRRDMYDASTPNTRRQVDMRGLQGAYTPQWGWCLWDEKRLLRRGLIDFELEDMYERGKRRQRGDESLATEIRQRIDDVGWAHVECVRSQYDDVERWVRARYEFDARDFAEWMASIGYVRFWGF